MADPFISMRSEIVPVDPDPTFAAQLRSRLQRALNLPKGVTVSNLTIEDEAEDVTSAQSAGATPVPAVAGATITPYIAVAGGEEAIGWYRAAFGARTSREPIIMDDGRIGHAELEVGGARFMLSDAFPEIGVTAPEPGAGATFSLVLTVADVDAVIAQAVEAGGALERAAADYPYGRNGIVRDPFGHRWMISSTPAEAAHRAPAGLRQGDIGYVSLNVPDTGRAVRFFSAVLGWEYGAEYASQSRQVEGLNIHHGIWGGVERSTLFLCFAVDDVDAAVARVRDAGGTAGEPHLEPYGRVSDCTDDDGVLFALYQPPSGTIGRLETVAEPTPRHGDLVYVTMETRSSAAARAFYGPVLGWSFQPGRVEDGWQVEDTVPMVGVSSGHDLPTGVPMYRVDDIAAAVERVREAGGSASDPDVQPYGRTSLCSDDQGTRFYLGQLS